MFISASGALSDLSYLRRHNPALKLVASLGGRAVKPAVFSTLLADESRLRNLTASMDDLHRRRGVIDGVEIDWEWPVGGSSPAGDKKDRERLVKYARVSE